MKIIRHIDLTCQTLREPGCRNNIICPEYWIGKVLRVVLVLSMGLCAGPTLAVDGFKVSAGRGSDEVDALRISAQWIWPYRWYPVGNWLFTGYWELALNHWNNEIKVTHAFPENLNATHELWVADFAPVFRWQRGTPTSYGLIPFLEVSTGGSIFSNRRLASKGVNPRFFGTHFQFMTHIGAGMRFGDQQQFEIKVRKYHYSNADIHRRNQGMDLYLLTYGYWF